MPLLLQVLPMDYYPIGNRVDLFLIIFTVESRVMIIIEPLLIAWTKKNR